MFSLKSNDDSLYTICSRKTDPRSVRSCRGGTTAYQPLSACTQASRLDRARPRVWRTSRHGDRTAQARLPAGQPTETKVRGRARRRWRRWHTRVYAFQLMVSERTVTPLGRSRQPPTSLVHRQTSSRKPSRAPIHDRERRRES